MSPSCFPHVINLAVHAILDALPMAARRFREQAAAKGDTLDQAVLEYLEALESGLVGACRESVKSTRSSDIRREGFREMIQNGNFEGRFKTNLGEIILLPLLQLLRDSETRWSSTYNMILRYLQLYPVRDTLFIYLLLFEILIETFPGGAPFFPIPARDEHPRNFSPAVRGSTGPCICSLRSPPCPRVALCRAHAHYCTGAPCL